MEITAVLIRKYRRFIQSLTETIEHFRNGSDRKGLEAFLCGIGDLEDIIQTCICFEDWEKISDVLPYVRILDEAIQNQDVTGMTDILEYKIYPLAKKWFEEMDKAS